jgi:hypothetical protein
VHIFEFLAIVNRFAEYERGALQSMMIALGLATTDLKTYLDQAGSGFDRLPSIR